MAVAVITAVVVALAVGFVLVLGYRAQHAALLRSAEEDTRKRIVGELTLRVSGGAQVDVGFAVSSDGLLTLTANGSDGKRHQVELATADTSEEARASLVR